jgi:hypothetical protein
MNKKILTILIFFLFTGQVDAASLNLKSDSEKIKIHNQFQVDIVLDSPDEQINTIGGKIVFPKDLIELEEIREKDSIINFWIEKPKIDDNGLIIFSGIIPGGYNESNGSIFSLIFKAINSGEGTISLDRIQAFKNDGLGTSLKLNLSDIIFYIDEYYENQEPFEIIDKERPEDFVVQVVKMEDLYDGKYFLVFATQDKGSGIDYYEVCEGNSKSCIRAESPYVLKNQDLNKKIYVRAIDKKGNQRTSIFYPEKTMRWYTNYIIFAIVLLIIVIIIYFVKKIWKKLKK